MYAMRGPNGIVLVDAGVGTHADTLFSNLSADFGTEAVAAVLITHGHLDHCGGAAGINAKTNCRIIASQETRLILERGDEQASGLRAARQQGLYPESLRFAQCRVSVGLRHDEQFEAGGLNWRALRVRGHSEDSVCYLIHLEGQRWLFSGDAVFYGGVLGVINADGSSMAGYRDDLLALRGLKIDGLFPGHGLFTLRDGQRHIDTAIEQMSKGFLPRQIGQGDLIF